MKRYQGIGVAVNLHLARFQEADREVASARAVMETRKVKALQQMLKGPWGAQWSRFGASYGVVGPDGKPQVQTMTISDEQTITGREQHSAEGLAIFQGASLGIREHTMLSKAVSHYVSADIVAEVTEASETLPNEPIFHTDLFTPYGFAVLETPLVAPDLDGDTGLVSEDRVVHVRAFGWSIEQMGTMDPNDLSPLRPGVTIWLYSTGQDLVNCGNDAADTYDPDELIPIEVAPWSFGKVWEPRNAPSSVEGTVPIPIAYERRWFLAFMRLCWQQIIVRRPHHPKRAEGRQWDRMAKRKELLDYTVLHLRREVDPNYRPLGMGVPLDHRVLVRGHWSFQYYPGLGGPARLPDGNMDPNNHRWIWIERHFRGDESLPMGAEHSATSVVR